MHVSSGIKPYEKAIGRPGAQRSLPAWHKGCLALQISVPMSEHGRTDSHPLSFISSTMWASINWALHQGVKVAHGRERERERLQCFV